MPEIQQPETTEELRRLLASAGQAKRAVELFGANTKRLMAGTTDAGGLQISTAKLNRIVQYEPRDLTISVEAGIGFAELNRELVIFNFKPPFRRICSASSFVLPTSFGTSTSLPRMAKRIAVRALTRPATVRMAIIKIMLDHREN